MIKKTLLLFIVLFVAYSIAIRIKPKLEATQHQWQDNVIKAENYLYNESDTVNKVLIGSSLSCRLVTDSLPDVYNLALNGQSAFEGLDIIRRKSTLPKVVYIETNVLWRPEKPDFTSGIFSPITYYSKKHFPSLRNNKQPLALTRIYYKRISKKVQRLLKGNKFVEPAKPTVSPLFKWSLQANVRNYTKFSKSDVDQNFLRLKRDVYYLKSKGVQVVSYEMPLNPALMELPLTRTLRKKLHTYFPENEFKYLKLPADSKGYITTDGMHLNNNEARAYTHYLKSNMEKL